MSVKLLQLLICKQGMQTCTADVSSLHAHHSLIVVLHHAYV